MGPLSGRLPGQGTQDILSLPRLPSAFEFSTLLWPPAKTWAAFHLGIASNSCKYIPEPRGHDKTGEHTRKSNTDEFFRKLSCSPWEAPPRPHKHPAAGPSGAGIRSAGSLHSLDFFCVFCITRTNLLSEAAGPRPGYAPSPSVAATAPGQ